MNEIVYMLHDNASQFLLGYTSYGIKEVKISVNAPNMNSIAERFVKSVRVEALDYFIILNQKQLKNILSEYICYYNTMRPHQGIDQNIPKYRKPKTDGKIVKIPILSGLHHHYSRTAA